MARQTFPDNTIFANSAPEITQPETSRWATGYESGAGKTPPSAGVHNYEFNRGDQMLQHIEQNGVPVWDARTIYPLRGWALGSDGMLYRSGINGNSGNDPVGGGGTYWTSLSDIVAPQASETVRGVAEVATSSEMDAGVDDSRVVTPKKIRLGVSFSKSANKSHIALPSWLGGFIIQAGKVINFPDNTEQAISLPMPFPANVVSVTASLSTLKNGSSYVSTVAARPNGLSQITIKSEYGESAQEAKDVYWIAFGY